MGKIDGKSVVVGMVAAIVLIKFVLPKVSPGLASKLG